MKRFVPWVTLLFACSSSSSSDPTALTQPIAKNVTLDRVTMLQPLEVPVMQDGDPADRGDIPLIALRDSVLRVFVTPGDGFQPHTLTARARIVTTSPTGSFAQVFSGSAKISSPSVEGDINTTINIPIAGPVLEQGSSVTVVVNDESGDSPSVGSSDARWPKDGSLADLGVRDGGDVLRVMIVPVQYDADGSHRLPDTSDDQIEAYRERFYDLYPTADVEITVHDPWPYSGVVSGTGNGISQLLTALAQLRSQDQPDPDVYYYAAFEPAATFGAYCGGGCITGLSNIGAPTSVGIGYTGQESTNTAVHEVGHAHGLYHAPCGGAGNPDPSFPYAQGGTGVWGYDSISPQMIDPSQYKDMMGYCSPTWISDYFYAKIFARARSDNQYFNDWMRGAPDARGVVFHVAQVAEAGPARMTDAASAEPWIAGGQPREITWDGGSGVAYFFPFDHLPGGTLYVPQGAPAGARVVGLRAGEAASTITR